MNKKPIIHIVHCIDTEGPLDEDIIATFGRLKSLFGIDLPATQENLFAIQNKSINFHGQEDAIAKCFNPLLLKYNKNWDEISKMLDTVMSPFFRNEMLDDFGSGWVYSWHCMDHVGLFDNPRHKDYGYGNIFRFYKNKILETGSDQDELNWHFHPLSLSRNPLHAATSYTNNFDILIQILCRRILEDDWFPTVNRPGFHSERPDSHLFLEQWIPFDYANQFIESSIDQPDSVDGRFGDWGRAPKTWRGYNPDHFDYQLSGNCRRRIFRCLNIGTRFRSLESSHLEEAYIEAEKFGSSIVAFADHDYRNISLDVERMRELIKGLKKNHPDVLIKFSGAKSAAQQILQYDEDSDFQFKIELTGKKLWVSETSGNLFGPQPFLAIKDRSGKFHHDNFDTILPCHKWCYVFDDQTIKLENVDIIGVGSASLLGHFFVDKIAVT